jgi:hypothetical protein
VNRSNRSGSTFGRIAAGLIVWLASSAWTPVFPEEFVQPSEIINLRSDARAQRDRAADIDKQATDWQKAADENFAKAESNDPNVKAYYSSRAKAQADRADELRKSAASVREIANQEEARANELQAKLDKYNAEMSKVPGFKPLEAPAPASTPTPESPPTPTEAQEANAAGSDLQPLPCRKLTPADLVGVWRDKKTGDPFAIEATNRNIVLAGGAPFKLHTMKRVWEGTYNEGAECGQPRMTFRFKPKPEAMNPKVPLWARKAVADKLEWVLELSEPMACGGAVLKAKFFPGKIKWRKDGEGKENGAAVDGEGKPRDFDLNQDLLVDGEAVGGPSIAIATEGQIDPWLHPAKGLLKLQRFDVLIALPQELAKQAGRSIEVTVRNLTKKDSTTLVVERPEGAVNRLYAVYQLASPATFADRDQEGERGSLTNPGDRIPLSASNGDLIEFASNYGTAHMRVYNTWIQAEIARQADLFNELLALYETAQTSPAVKPEDRELARRRLQMVQNAQKLIANSDYVDQVKLAIGRFYLESAPLRLGKQYGDEEYPVLQRRELRWYGPENPVPPDPPDSPFANLNIPWTSAEETAVEGVIYDAKKETYASVMDSYGKAVTYGLYAGVTNAPVVPAVGSVANIFSLATGRDIFNQPLPPYGRLLLATNIALNLFVNAAMSGKLDFLAREINIGGGKSIKRKLTPTVAAGGESLPPSINGERPSLIIPDDIIASEALTCESEALSSAGGGTSGAAMQPSGQDLARLKRAWGPNARFNKTDAKMQSLRQTTTVCQSQAVARAFQISTNNDLTQQDMMVLWRAALEQDEGLKKLFNARNENPNRSQLGLTNRDVAKIVELLEGETKTSWGVNDSMAKVRAHLENGWFAKDQVVYAYVKKKAGGDIQKAGSSHAVLIEGFVKEPFAVPGSGTSEMVTGVTVFDSNFGYSIDVPLCDYEAMRQPNGANAAGKIPSGTQYVRFGQRTQPGTGFKKN